MLQTRRMRSGFTFMELIVYMTLISIVLLPLGDLMKYSLEQLKKDNDNFISNYTELIDDLKYDTTINKTIAYTTNSITITRLDNCVVNYIHNTTNLNITKTITGCDVGALNVRSYIVNKIKTFKVEVNSFNNYDIKINKTFNDTNYRYTLYNRNF